MRYSIMVIQYRGTVHVVVAEGGKARVAGSGGTPAVGLRPQPAREKGFLLISCLI